MLSIVIQAGGQSQRMGQDKGLMLFMGQSLVARMVERLEPIADELLVTTNRPEAYRFLGIPIVPDRFPGHGALGGLYTALSAASQPLAAVVACDMPFINPHLLLAERNLLLATASDLVVPHSGEGLEPLHAIYDRVICLPHLLQALEAGKWRVDSWFDQVELRVMQIEEIQQYDQQMLSFLNVNTPEEFEKAVRFASQGQP